MPTLGKRIKAFRLQRGFTQEQLATALNTTKAAISRYEANKRQPRYEQIIEIANILNVQVVDLLVSCKTELNTSSETEVYLRELDHPAEDMLRTGGLPLKNESLLIGENSYRGRAMTKLLLGTAENSDTIEPLLKAFNKLDFWGRLLVIECAETLASNPAFLCKNASDTEDA